MSVESTEHHNVIVVSHTHWDREWYLTFEEYRYWLVQAIDRLLEIMDRELDFRFMLDGQVIPILDYLVIRPEREARLRELVQAGRLLIGPWYVQPDEFLVSGEALIRNLLLGHRLSERFGGVMKEGYVPDTFGHIPQLPQILKGFRIKTAFITRGADLATEEVDGSEFLWEAPEGSKVLAHVMEMGYCAGAFLSSDLTDPSSSLQEFYERDLLPKEYPPLLGALHLLRSRSSAHAALLLNGCDHLGPQADILDVLRRLNDQLPEFHFHQGTLTEYAHLVEEATPKLPVIQGEFRAGKRHFILSGVYSARMYLKQQNTALQTLLERYGEPLTAFASLLGRDRTPFIWAAWELVLQNHAHDSIYGTGIDQVHREMMTRYSRAETIAREVIRDSLRGIGSRIGADPGALEGEIPILIFNPSSLQRQEEVIVEVEPEVPSSLEKRSKSYRLQKVKLELTSCTLLDPSSKEIPFTIRGEQLVSEDILNGAKHLHKKLVAFPADLPPLGLKLYRLVPGKAPSEDATSLIVDKRTLENEFYRLYVCPDGTLEVLEKESGHLYQGLGFIEDSGDAGDEYNYCSPLHQEIITSRGDKAQVQVAEDLPWKGTLRIELTLSLPQGLTEDRQARSKETVDCPVTVFVSLQRGLKRIDIALEVENNARDHRLRVGFPLGFPAEYSFAEDAFWVIRRPTRPLRGEGWMEKPANTHPQKSFVAVEDNKGGVAILNRGLPEYEVTEDGRIFITLLRGVGWLSRDDLSLRRGHAGPPYPTPDAQCLGRHRFELGIYTYKETWEEARVWKVAHAFCAPPIGVRLTDLGQGTLPVEVSILSIDPVELTLSTVKQAEDGNGFIVRVYNPTGRSLSGMLKSLWKISRAESVGLDETPQGEIRVSPEGIPLTVKSGEIKTVKLVFAP